MNDIFGGLLGGILCPGSASGRHNPNAAAQGSLAQQRQQELMRQVFGAQQAQTDQQRVNSLMSLYANAANQYQRPTAPRPPTEREIAIRELRECLGDELWEFTYMDGLHRDVRDLR